MDRGAAAVYPKPFEMANLLKQLDTLTTPRLERWQTVRTVEEFSESAIFPLHVESIAEQSAQFAKGQGGFSVLTKSRPVAQGQEIWFCVMDRQSRQLAGHGKVCWIHYQAVNKEMNLGICIDGLTEASLETFETISSSRIAFIPKPPHGR
jgi:hypothetical protein